MFFATSLSGNITGKSTIPDSAPRLEIWDFTECKHQIISARIALSISKYAANPPGRRGAEVEGQAAAIVSSFTGSGVGWKKCFALAPLAGASLYFKWSFPNGLFHKNKKTSSEGKNTEILQLISLSFQFPYPNSLDFPGFPGGFSISLDFPGFPV